MLSRVRVFFAEGSWRALDVANRQVAGVMPGSLPAALRLVRRGRVATIYGQLIPQARVVDVEWAGPEHGADGYAVVDAV